MSAFRRYGRPAEEVTAEPAALEGVLVSAIEEGRQRFPNLALTDEQYLDHLARLLESVELESLARLHHADLYLCCACACGDQRAVTILEDEYVPLAEGAARAVLRGDHDVADVIQQLRGRLLTSDGQRRASIESYSGRGPLSGWLRTSAKNLALNAIRTSKNKAEVAFDDAPTAQPSAHPELALLKARFRPELQEAMAFAFARLQTDQKSLLRAYVVEAKTLEQIAESHGVATSTVSRWLARVRDKLARDAKRRFSESTELPAAECESLIREVTGSMHLSVGRLLRQDPA